MNRLKIILLAGLTAIDLAAALFAWRSFTGAEAGDSLAAHSAAAIVPPTLSDALAVMEGEDPETLARPLFTKSRRPFQGPSRAANAINAAPPPAGLKLHAVIGFNHKVRAFVTSNAVAEGKWVSVGETFENWTVDSIAVQEIALRQDADVLRIGLDYDEIPGAVGPIPVYQPPIKVETREDAPAPKAMPPDAPPMTKGARRDGR